MTLIVSTSLICIFIVILMITTSYTSRGINPINGRRFVYSPYILFSYAFVITFVAAFRNGFQDTDVYKGIYSYMGTDYSFAFNEELSIQDYGFNLFMIFLNRINPDTQFVVIISSIIIYSCYFYIIGKYAQDLPLSLLLMMTLDLISSMNGIRQVMAGAITLLGLPFIRDKKPIPYFLLVLLASTLHKSALVLIPLYFVISGKRLNLGIWIFLSFVAVSFAFPELATSVMGDLLEDSVYEEYLAVESTMGIMRFLVALVPFILTILYCWVQQDNHTGEIKGHSGYLHQRLVDVMINMAVVSFGFMTLGMRMVYFARISLYFNCVLSILLPTLFSGIFRKESAHFMRILSTVLYMIFYAYQIYSYNLINGWNSFKLNL